jgi:hypothetical protein
LKTDDDLNYLKKYVEQLFPKPQLDASESAKNTFVCDVTKVENFDKKISYFNKKEPEKLISTFTLRYVKIPGVRGYTLYHLFIF